MDSVLDLFGWLSMSHYDMQDCVGGGIWAEARLERLLQQPATFVVSHLAESVGRRLYKGVHDLLAPGVLILGHGENSGERCPERAGDDIKDRRCGLLSPFSIFPIVFLCLPIM